MREPLWLSLARMTEGISEIPGKDSNPIIMRWAAEIGAPSFFANDDIAWCNVWMNRVMMAAQLPLSGTGFELLRAESFARWGAPLVRPVLGCVTVIKRPAGHHVGLYLGEDATRFYLYGGNTGNRVAAAWMEKARLVAHRWPLGVPVIGAGPVLLAANGVPTSTNEA